MKKILLTGLLLATSNAYSRDFDRDLIELDDFQDMNQSCSQYPGYNDYYRPEPPEESDIENIEEVLKKFEGKNHVST